MDCLQPAFPEMRHVRRFETMRPRDPGRIEAQIATADMMDIVHTLRHDSYVSQGVLDAHPTGRFSDDWDDHPNSQSVLVFCNGDPVASVRATILDKSLSISKIYHRTVAMDCFDAEVNELVDTYHQNGRTARTLEMSRLVRRPDFSKDADIVFAMYRMTFYLVILHQAEIILSTVRAHHMPFYRRLGFEKITDPRPYPRLNFLIGLMACFQPSYAHVQRTVPIIDYIHEDDCIFTPFGLGERVRVFQEMDKSREIGKRPAFFSLEPALSSRKACFGHQNIPLVSPAPG